VVQLDYFEVLVLDPSLPAFAWMSLFGLSFIALITDLLYRRVPNLLILVGLLLGVGVSTSSHGALGTIYSLVGALAGLFGLLGFFALRLLGAGDVKLMAVIGSFVGLKAILWILLYTLICGGVLSFLWFAVRGKLGVLADSMRDFFAGMSFAPELFATKVDHIAKHSAARLPYAAAILAGTLSWFFANPVSTSFVEGITPL
jgi:prepilin peptidase CpaA